MERTVTDLLAEQERQNQSDRESIIRYEDVLQGLRDSLARGEQELKRLLFLAQTTTGEIFSATFVQQGTYDNETQQPRDIPNGMITENLKQEMKIPENAIIFSVVRDSGRPMGEKFEIGGTVYYLVPK